MEGSKEAAEGQWRGSGGQWRQWRGSRGSGGVGDRNGTLEGQQRGVGGALEGQRKSSGGAMVFRSKFSIKDSRLDKAVHSQVFSQCPLPTACLSPSSFSNL